MARFLHFSRIADLTIAEPTLRRAAMRLGTSDVEELGPAS